MNHGHSSDRRRRLDKDDDDASALEEGSTPGDGIKTHSAHMGIVLLKLAHTTHTHTRTVRKELSETRRAHAMSDIGFNKHRPRLQRTEFKTSGGLCGQSE